MKNRKVIIVSIILAVVMVGSSIFAIAMRANGQGGNSTEGIGGKTVVSKEVKALTATSYNDIYNQLLLAKVRDFFSGIRGYDSDIVEESVPSSESAKADDGTNQASDTNGSTSYGKTNVQVENVDEGDIIKNDGTYLYCLQNKMISIIDPDTKNMHVLANIKIDSNVQEFYVIGKQLVVVSQNGDRYFYYEYSDVIENSFERNERTEPEKEEVQIDVYDIDNPEKPSKISTVKQDGWFQTSRISDGYLYTISQKNMYGTEFEKKDPGTFIPSVNGEILAYDDVMIPDTSVCKGYLVISSLELAAPTEFKDSKAIFSNAYEFYVSTENIYITDALFSRNGDDVKTLITKIYYNDGILTPTAKGKVQGGINDNFSLDEYKGYLRVVTTEASYKRGEYVTSNNLFVLDEELKSVGSIENLAKDEMIYSARFMGDVGYFVTFRQVDPLFSVDLSDPKNPKIIGKLKIPGFSSYLHFYKDNLLLGIGQEADSETGRTKGLKISMFDISDPSDVKEVDKMYFGENTESEALYNYKAILADGEKNVIGFAYNNWGGEHYEASKYGVFSYDRKHGFKKELDVKSDVEDYPCEFRGTYIGNTFYVLNLRQTENHSDIINSYIEAYDMKDYSFIDKATIDK